MESMCEPAAVLRNKNNGITTKPLKNIYITSSFEEIKKTSPQCATASSKIAVTAVLLNLIFPRWQHAFA